MAGQNSFKFDWSWTEVSILGSQVFWQASMESCDVEWLKDYFKSQIPDFVILCFPISDWNYLKSGTLTDWTNKGGKWAWGGVSCIGGAAVFCVQCSVSFLEKEQPNSVCSSAPRFLLLNKHPSGPGSWQSTNWWKMNFTVIGLVFKCKKWQTSAAVESAPFQKLDIGINKFFLT